MVNCEGQNDDLWVGSKGGLSRLSRSTNRFDVVDLGEGKSDVRAILPFDDHLLLAIRGHGLLRYDWTDGSLQTINNAQGDPVLGDAFVQLLMRDRDGQIWAGTHSGVFVPEENLSVTKTIYTSSGLPHARVCSLYESPDCIIWIGTSGGLTRCDPNDPVLRILAGPDFFPDNDVLVVWQDQSGNLFAGTQAGITIFAAQIQNLVCDFRWRLIGWVLWDQLGVLQTSSAMLLIRIPPSIKLDLPIPRYRHALRALPIFSAC